jgi:hypothetical protein
MKKSLELIIIVLLLLIIFEKTNIINLIRKAMFQKFPDAVLKLNFDKLKKNYPIEICKNVEKIYALETNDFCSGGLKLTNGAGMEGFTRAFPFGWKSLETFWSKNESVRPTHVISMNENKQPDITGSGKVVLFIVFPTLYAGLAAVAERLKYLKNNPAADRIIIKVSL